MSIVRIILLCGAVVGVLLRPRRWPVWALAVGAAGGGPWRCAPHHRARPSATHSIRWSSRWPSCCWRFRWRCCSTKSAFFVAVAARIDHSHRLHLGLWVFAALVTTIFNLDASVVLLTPLYVRIARRHGLDPLAAGFIPVLLACFASSALVVSNLTNLLAAARFGADTGDFIRRLGPASLVATVIGYVAYRHTFPEAERTSGTSDPVPPRALRVGVPIVAFIVVGFNRRRCCRHPRMGNCRDCRRRSARGRPPRVVAHRAVGRRHARGVVRGAGGPRPHPTSTSSISLRPSAARGVCFGGLRPVDHCGQRAQTIFRHS